MYHAQTKIVVFVRSLPLFRWTVLNNTHAAANRQFLMVVAILKRTTKHGTISSPHQINDINKQLTPAALPEGIHPGLQRDWKMKCEGRQGTGEHMFTVLQSGKAVPAAS